MSSTTARVMQQALELAQSQLDNYKLVSENWGASRAKPAAGTARTTRAAAKVQRAQKR